MVNQSNKSIFAFTFIVHRTAKKKWYQFWLRNSAEVYSYVYSEDLDEAKNIVKNDMNKRGFDKIGTIGSMSEIHKSGLNSFTNL